MRENTLIEHRVMLPPKAAGTITYIAIAVDYKINVSEGRKGREVGLGAEEGERRTTMCVSSAIHCTVCTCTWLCLHVHVYYLSNFPSGYCSRD